MTDYDVIVIGAGPAGVAAGYDLALNHFSVLLIDKHQFPRMKACAGGLTVKAVNALRYSMEPVVQTACRSMVLGRGFKKRASLKSETPLVFMTDRRELDAYCLERAVQAGAAFHVTKEIKAVIERDTSVEILTEQGWLRSKFLVGADGANSVIRKLCNPFRDFRRGFAIEMDVPLQDVRRYVMTIDFGVVPSGYGWMFPKKDHVNVGVYTCDHGVRLKSGHLIRYCKQKTGRSAAGNMAAHYIGLGGWGYVPGGKRIFLAGDAAGLADPLLGEGLHNAIKSGQAAADAMILSVSTGEDPMACYLRNIASIQADIWLGYRVARWFYRFPALGYAALTLPVVRDRLLKGYASGMTFDEIKKSLLRFPRR